MNFSHISSSPLSAYLCFTHEQYAPVISAYPFDRINKTHVARFPVERRRKRGRKREEKKERKKRRSGKREFAFHPVYAHTAAESRTIFAGEKCNAQPAPIWRMATELVHCCFVFSLCPLCTPVFLNLPSNRYSRDDEKKLFAFREIVLKGGFFFKSGDEWVVENGRGGN